MRARRVTFAALTTFGAAVGLVPAAAHADSTTNTIYVDSSNPNCVGNATGSGTQADPYCGLSTLYSVQPGTTVLVAPGHGYTWGLQLNAAPDPNSAPIVITGVGGHVKIRAGFQFQNVDNVTVQGFDFTDGGVSGFVGSHNISVLHNTFTADTPTPGAAVSGATTVAGNTVAGPYANGILVNGGQTNSSGEYTKPNVVEGNDVSGVAAGGKAIGIFGPNVEVSDNRVHGNDTTGISSNAYLGGYGAERIVNNMVWANGGPGISIATGITDYVTSNTVVGNNGAQISVSDQPSGHGPVFVRNNIVASHDNTMASYSGTVAAAPSAGIQTDAASWSSTTIESNIVDVPGGTAYTNGNASYQTAAALQQAGKGAHDITATPGLNPDGTLKAGSPAIDSADSGADGEQAQDIDGGARTDDPATTNTGLGVRSYDDRGAKESGSTPGTRPDPASAPPVLPHTDCGVAAVPSDPAAGNPNGPVLTSTDLPPIAAGNGHNLFQGTPGVIHAHSTGGTGGVVCFEFIVDSQSFGGLGTTVVPADANGNADLIVAGTSWGSQYVSVIAIDKAGHQSSQGMYQFYSVGGNAGTYVQLSTVGVTGQTLGVDVTGHATTLPAGASYQFEFGDGSATATQTAATARHVYTAPGTYAVEVRLVDGTGAIITEDAKYVSVPQAAVVTPPPPGGGNPPPSGGGTPPPPPDPGAGGPAVGRIFGGDRYGTGVNVSLSQWPAGKADAVVLAKGGNFPDALSGVPLAAHHHGPLLLTDGTSLDPQVSAEIQRVLGPDHSKTVYIMGGTSAVSPGVQQAVQRLGYKITRYGGTDRYATALQVAESFGPTRHVIVATGADFADALSAGPLGAVEDAPIVLSDNKVMDADTAAFVSGHSAIEAVGGQAVDAVEQDAKIPSRSITPLSGLNRYETSNNVAGFLASIAKPAPTGAAMASGVNFPDALTGGAYAANAGEPLLLTDPQTLPAVIAARLSALAPQLRSITLFGGPNAVSTAVENQVVETVHGHRVS
ncbi:putative cell wall-binding protein [Catenulispora sp. GP43]|uniref:cell wall-binding repeat-containing protein n=1 Tax=Catenulispora sp. GP43 TaxID=3156263 RepID=UPI003516FF25